MPDAGSNTRHPDFYLMQYESYCFERIPAKAFGLINIWIVFDWN
jgi:hypothetical protein